MSGKSKLLFGDALKLAMNRFTEKWTEREQQELKDMGAWPVVNDTFSRIKNDMATKPSDDRIRGMAKDLTRSNITMVIAALNKYEPCSFDDLEYEDEIDEWNMCIKVARAYAKRLESVL